MVGSFWAAVLGVVGVEVTGAPTIACQRVHYHCCIPTLRVGRGHKHHCMPMDRVEPQLHNHHCTTTRVVIATNHHCMPQLMGGGATTAFHWESGGWGHCVGWVVGVVTTTHCMPPLQNMGGIHHYHYMPVGVGAPLPARWGYHTAVTAHPTTTLCH